MPIKGLSERRRFSRGGKVRLGKKAVNQRGAEYPQKSDHFIFDPEDEALLPLFRAAFGEKAKRIRIAFASDDAEEVFPQYYKLYGHSGLVCKGDGDVAMRNVDGELVECDCPGPDNCELARQKGVHGKPGCKQVASLQFFIPELPVMQVFQIDTTSYNSIININSALAMLRKVAGRIDTVGVAGDAGLRGLDLVLKPQQATNPDTGKKIVIYVLDLVIPVGLSQVSLLQSMATYAGLPAPAASEDLPDDLYARSQVTPRADEGDDDGTDVDPETGEILPEPEPEPVAAASAAKETSGNNGNGRRSAAPF